MQTGKSNGVFAFGLSPGLNEVARLELLRTASERCEEFATFEFVRDVFFARCMAARADEIARLVDVMKWRQSDVTMARLVRSIDTQCMIAMTEEMTLATNGIRNAVPIAELVDGRPVYPVLSLRDDAPHWSGDPATNLPTRHCYVGAVNVSLQNKTREDPRAFDPVTAALSAAAQRFPVTLAAGNVDGDSDPIIFGWPLNPDVITVGAVDSSLTRLLDVSRVGSKNGSPGPDVVANGVDETGETGTSFAAPVVATQLALLAAALMAVRAVALSSTDSPEGVPIAGRCFVDWDRALAEVGGHAFQVADFNGRLRPLPALPLGVVTAGAGALLGAETSSALRNRPGAQRLRHALLASAREVAGYETFEVGHGVVSLETTRDYLARLTIGGLGSLYEDQSLTAATKVFDERLLDEFLAGAQESMIGWASGITDFDEIGGMHFVEPAPEAAAQVRGTA